MERGRQTLGRFFGWLKTTLASSPYLVGDRYTMADITAQCAVDFMAWVEIGVPEANIHTRRWYSDVSSRPSAKG